MEKLSLKLIYLITHYNVLKIIIVINYFVFCIDFKFDNTVVANSDYDLVATAFDESYFEKDIDQEKDIEMLHYNSTYDSTSQTLTSALVGVLSDTGSKTSIDVEHENGEHQVISYNGLSNIQGFQPGSCFNIPMSFDTYLATLQDDWPYLILQGFMPNFENTLLKPIRTYEIDHSLLENSKIYVFTTNWSFKKYKNKNKNETFQQKIEWHMAVAGNESNPKIWIEKITPDAGQISSFGSKIMVIDSGFLTNKPVEYTSQCTIFLRTRKTEPEKYRCVLMGNNDKYMDITPQLQKIYPIKMFTEWLRKNSEPSLDVQQFSTTTGHSQTVEKKTRFGEYDDADDHDDYSAEEDRPYKKQRRH